jgi:hypothetical protein
MTGREKIIAAILAGLALAGRACADMVPASQLACESRPAPSVTDRATLPSPACSGQVLDYQDFNGLEFVPLDFAPRATADPGPAASAQPVHILADGQDSFSLCLYALLGLGLCKSAPFVKKFSFGYIPQWYHDGGPAQIGPSLAISPDCLCPAPVCFVQPAARAGDRIPRYHFATVASLWRHSQFTPAVLAPRAPPCLT